ncbi:MAG: hypothetical protein K2M55_05315 [Muribaculaceae bacterium]|nr:hypothetical protein [Muribaculaceae bacterium]
MTKNIISAFVAMMLLAIAPASAQQKSGRWTVYPTAGENFTNVIETPNKTYLHSGTGLFSLSADNETYAYNYFNKLSDSNGIIKIAYNADGGYLLVAYSNGNIDLIYDDGSVVNMPEIKDAVINTTRTINSVDFADGKIYLGTAFGMVVYDDNTHLVLESGIFNKSVSYIFVMGDHIVLVVGNDVYVAPTEGRHAQLDKFTKLDRQVYFKDIARLNDNTLLYAHTSGVYSYTIDFSNFNTAAASTGVPTVDKFYRCDDGVYAIQNNQAVIFSEDGTTERVTLPEGFSSVFFNDLKSVWVDSNGSLTRYNLSGDTPTLTMQAWAPEAITTTQPVQLVWSCNGDRLYVSNRCNTYYLNTDAGGKIYATMVKTAAIHPDGSITDEQPMNIPKPTTSVDFDRVSKENKTDRMIGGPCWMTVDPDDPGTYYFATKAGGVFVVKDGEYLQLINSSNCPGEKDTWTEEYECVSVDPWGNLWVLSGIDNAAKQNINMLPAAKRRDIKNVTKADWQRANEPSNFSTRRDAKTYFFKDCPYAIFDMGGWGDGFFGHFNNNTPSNAQDDKYVLHKSVRDQNGNNIGVTFLTDAVSDHDGKIWVATSQGCFVIENPADLMESTLNVRRPIVAYNDGTGLGDYLLQAEQINKIAVDHANRKWLATASSGVYLVSEDGREILANYNTLNSALPSDYVYSVAVDPNSNKVYFGTDAGVVSYDSDSSPAAEDYSSVYAYPNPVRPEYTGWITVAGLMDNSLVKIADAAGNVLYQTRSEGGMVSWDGCDPSGRRVRTGVYYVFASQNTDGNSGGVVAKILVVN